MSFSWGDVTQWSPGPLETAFTELTSRRDELVACQDELDAMGTPGHWVGDAAEGARTARRELSDQLEVLVAQVSAARRALADGADACEGLERKIEDALSYARDHGLAIGSDGSVEDVEGAEGGAVGFEAREQLAERTGLVNTCADLVEQALDAAVRVDRDLCVVFDGIRDDEVEVDASTLSGASLDGYLGGAGGLGPPPDGTPQESAAWWEQLTDLQREYVLEHHPDLVGNRDGIPFGVRDEANRSLLEQHREDLEQQLREAEARSNGPRYQFTESSEVQELRAKLEALEEIERLAALEDRQVVLLDFSDGRAEAAVAQGDLDGAGHLGVFTPGLESDVSENMDDYDQKLEAVRQLSADALVNAMTPAEVAAAGGLSAAREAALADVATVSWIGYQSPQLEGTVGPGSVAGSGAAEDGGAALADFLRGIQATREDDPEVTALGHSYGSTTTGYALREEGTGVDRVGFFGSPGVSVDDVGDLRVPDGGAYYLEARNDPVGDLGRFGPDPSLMPGMTQLETGGGTAADGTRLDEVTGHTSYFDPGSTSQYNLAHLIVDPDGVLEGGNVGFGDGFREGLGW